MKSLQRIRQAWLLHCSPKALESLTPAQVHAPPSRGAVPRIRSRRRAVAGNHPSSASGGSSSSSSRRAALVGAGGRGGDLTPSGSQHQDLDTHASAVPPGSSAASSTAGTPQRTEPSGIRRFGFGRSPRKSPRPDPPEKTERKSVPAETSSSSGSGGGGGGMTSLRSSFQRWKSRNTGGGVGNQDGSRMNGSNGDQRKEEEEVEDVNDGVLQQLDPATRQSLLDRPAFLFEPNVFQIRGKARRPILRLTPSFFMPAFWLARLNHLSIHLPDQSQREESFLQKRASLLLPGGSEDSHPQTQFLSSSSSHSLSLFRTSSQVMPSGTDPGNPMALVESFRSAHPSKVAVGSELQTTQWDLVWLSTAASPAAPPLSLQLLQTLIVDLCEFGQHRQHLWLNGEQARLPHTPLKKLLQPPVASVGLDFPENGFPAPVDIGISVSPTALGLLHGPGRLLGGRQSHVLDGGKLWQTSSVAGAGSLRSMVRSSSNLSETLERRDAGEGRTGDGCRVSPLDLWSSPPVSVSHLSRAQLMILNRRRAEVRKADRHRMHQQASSVTSSPDSSAGSFQKMARDGREKQEQYLMLLEDPLSMLVEDTKLWITKLVGLSRAGHEEVCRLSLPSPPSSSSSRPCLVISVPLNIFLSCFFPVMGCVTACDPRSGGTDLFPELSPVTGG